MAESGDVLAGKYRLDRVLGSGGMGEIWLAYHVLLGVNVAVKLMSPALIPDATARARFRREARAAARLRSPHVVAVQDFGEDGGAPYLVMEALEGETLEKHTGKRPLDPLEATELVDQAARGLGSAHAHGVVHRDIKPSNLFLANVGGQSVLKIIDFGIARALNDEQEGKVTRSGAILGSPTFMSPEQASGDPATHASDLWSLAAVTYWMVTGREPFAGRMMSETLHRIRTAQFTKATEVIPRLPCAIDGFFAKAFRIDPRERYESAEELAAAFRAVVVGDESFSTLLQVGVVSKSRRARAPRRRWYRGPLAWVLMGSSVTAGAVVLSRLPGVPHSAESQPAAARTAVPALKPESADHGKPRAMRIPSAESPIDAVPTAPRPTAARRPTTRARPPKGSKLTPEPVLATPGPSGESIDPLFGIRLKRPPPVDALESEASREPGATPR